MNGYHDSQKRRTPTHEHIHPSDHFPNIRSILPSTRSTHSLHHPLGSHDTPFHSDGTEREKYEGKVKG